MIYRSGVPVEQSRLGEQFAWGVYSAGQLVWKRDPETFEIVNTGTYPIPAYARFLDCIMIGGGASGQTGNGAANYSGRGGNPGSWLGVTLERGVDFGMEFNTINITVGQGGTRPANHNDQAPISGGSSGVSVGSAVAIAPGGIGRRSENVQVGKEADNYEYRGVTYYGGGGGIKTDPAGQVPGGGGFGGDGGIFDNKVAGWPGGNGTVWVVARSF